MPALPRRRPAAPAVRVVVLGDLMLDVVLAPARPLETGTDVPGTVALRQGGSAANTARWLARLGVRTTLVAAVGRDPAGRALVDSLRRDGVRVRAAHVARARTGRIGVIVAPGGERSFVADRAAADGLEPADLKPSWFAVDGLHLPAYSLIGEPLGRSGRRAI
ncbi:MAG: carbohydrate kinase family protein, partial [Chloroflexota bacterium]